MQDFNKLNREYQILNDDNKKAHRILNLISMHVPHLVFNKSSKEILYLSKVKGIYYLDNNNGNNCLICGKDKLTTAHHLIPKRAKCKNKILKELRIRICEDCDKLVHLENKVFRSKVLANREEMILNLKKKVKELRLKLTSQKRIGVK